MLSDHPKTLKVRLVCENSDDYIPAFYRSIPLRDTEPIRTQLEKEIPFWTPTNPVLLNLPPGTGKTSFVYETLIPAALAQGKNLLLVSNRVALSTQQKRAIMKKLCSPLSRLLTDEGVRQAEDFGPVRVITYHRLPALVKDVASSGWMANLAFAVFDEAHYFASDALFNGFVEYHLRLACERFCHAVRVYMTGTSWDVLQPLAEAELKFYHRRTFYAQWTPPREFIRYTFPADFHQYRLRFFSELNDLHSLIQQQPEAKWLIFVDSKERGRSFSQALGNSATYLDADSKGSDMWNRIVFEKKFESQVLVTTAALDVGIDILDPAVQNIAVMADNRTALLQMAGRRRILGEDLVNLWVYDLSKTAISIRRRSYTAWLQWFERLDQCCRPEHYQVLMEQLWREGDPGLRELFRLKSGRIYGNKLAEHVLRRRCFLFERILRGETTFKREVELWLDLDPDATGAAAALHRFYAEYGEQALDEALQEDLRQLVNTCCAEAGYREPQPTRNDTHRERALTNRLRKTGLPYEIKLKAGAWVLRKNMSMSEKNSQGGCGNE